MISDAQLKAMTAEEHSAWLGGLSDDERLVVYCPLGHRYIILIVSHIKRALVTLEMSIGTRLELLEGLHRLVGAGFSADDLAMIEPMCATSAEMMREARKLDQGRVQDFASFNILTSCETFWSFMQLNPSFLDVLRRRAVSRQSATHSERLSP